MAFKMHKVCISFSFLSRLAVQDARNVQQLLLLVLAVQDAWNVHLLLPLGTHSLSAVQGHDASCFYGTHLSKQTVDQWRTWP